ncbi:MAG: hypothetical protein HPY50_04285 [Firmicutes bacterium]|nr:hypothetical protein [Bacillota bacterium]
MISIDSWVEGGAVAAALLALVVRLRGMKKYIIAALFASLFTDFYFTLATQVFHWWDYHGGILKEVGLSFSYPDVIIPIAAMFVVRYWPHDRKSQALWGLAWSGALTGFDYFCANYTTLMEFKNGFTWYYDVFLWAANLLAWYVFYRWFVERRLNFVSRKLD